MKRFAAAIVAALALTASPALAAEGLQPGNPAVLTDGELDQVTAGTELEIENVTLIFVKTGGHSVVQIVDDSKNVIQLGIAGNVWLGKKGKGNAFGHLK